MKAYVEFDGVKYYDYDAYIVDCPSWYNLNKKYILDDVTIKTLLEKIQALKTTAAFVPAKGDEICIVPDCKYNLEDIRKNYKIKRGFDKGTCNVFSEETIERMDGGGYGSIVAAVPSEKIVFLNFYNEKDKTIKAIRSVAPSVADTDVVWSTRYEYMTCCDLNEAYMNLLLGTSSTPDVHIDSLDLNGGGELDLDTLEIVRRLCGETVNTYSGGWDEKLKIQLAALNGLDWRKYPGTIDVLFNGFIYKGCSAFNAMKSCSSRYPKNVRNFLKYSHEGFASQEDMDLASRFIRTVLKIEDVEFTDMQNLAQKMVDGHVNWLTFYRLFDNMVRFKDKGWKGE